MKKKARGSNLFKQTTFWKCWSGFISGGIIAFVIGILIFNAGTIVSRPAGDDQILYRQEAVRIIRAIQQQWLGPVERQLTALSQSLKDNQNDHEEILKKWLNQQTDIVGASIWYRNQEEPLRAVADRYWQQLRQPSVSPIIRSQMLNFLFSGPRMEINSETNFYTGPVQINDVSGKTLVSLGMLSLDRRFLQGIEVKVTLERLDSLIQAIGDNGTGIIVCYRNRIIAATDTTGFNSSFISTQDTPIIDNNLVYLSVPMDKPKWIVTVSLPFHTQTVVSKKQFNFDGMVLGIFFILIGSTLAALAVSHWIDSPLKRLINTARDIARGNFEQPIPLQKSSQMNRLVKIFNYMAGEMERFQQLDVHEIISAKNEVETIVRNIADGVIVTDLKDKIVLFNSVIEKWFDLDEKEVIGKQLVECLKNDQLIKLIASVRQGEDSGQGEFSINLQGFRKPRIFLAHAALLKENDGRKTGVVTIIRDITKEKEADQIKTELVSMVAHELKSPLTSIYGFSELLLNDALPSEDRKEYARVVLNESHRLTELVNKFLDLSRLEAGKTKVSMNPFDLKQLVNKVIEVHSGQADKKNIRVLTEITQNLPLASGDQDLVEQVLVNLFCNAIKYSPVNSKIGIDIQVEHQMLTVNVVDNGYGIPKEALSRIFDKFYRVVENEDDDESAEGSGLGLALAREIVEQHGGTIKVSSKLGVGSVFTFTIPQANIG